MKYTYEIAIELINAIRTSNLSITQKGYINTLLFKVIDDLTWNKETQMMDYTIDMEDEQDEHKYYY